MSTDKLQIPDIISDMDNPFPGLRAFGVEESHLFFGREGQSEIVLEYLAKNRFAAVTGASGSGKSSLIYCGLIPVLLGGFITGAGSDWQVITTRPGNRPIQNLANSLVDSETEESGNTEILKNLVNAQLRRNSMGLVDAIKQRGLKEGQNLLILIDQFEELFRYRSSRDNRITTVNETETYISILVNAIHQRKLPIYVVLTMRSDFISECSMFQEFTKLINDSNFLVPQMKREDFSKAILGPLSVAGAEIDKHLFHEILNSIGEGSDQLPVLQHVMMRTWSYWKKYNEARTPIRLRDYEAAGKMDNALSMHANEAYEELSDEGKRICKSMFKTLTQKSIDNKGIRHPATISEIAEIAIAANDDVIHVVNVFRSKGRSFLTPGGAAELDENTVIDISHEALMRVWDRLRGWVEEESNSVQMYMRLSEAANLYQLGKTGLWRPPDLQLAVNWRNTNKPTLSWAKKYNPAFEKVMVFLDASEKKFQQEEQDKIKLQRRTLNRTRRFAIFMGVASVILLLAMTFAVSQQREANKQRGIAESYASLMEREKNVAVELKDQKELERLRAMRLRDSAEMAKMSAMLQLSEVQEEAVEAYELAGEALQRTRQAEKTSEQAMHERELAERSAEIARAERSQVEQEKMLEMRKRMLTTAQTMAIKALQTNDIDIKGLLAKQAYEFNKTYHGIINHPDVYKGLFSVLVKARGANYNALKGHEGSVRSVVFYADKNQLFSSGADGNILQWDFNRAQPKATRIKSNNFSNRTLEISSNGRWLACGTGSSSIQIFNLNQLNVEPDLLSAHKGAVVDIAFVEGKDIMLSIGSDKTVIKWNLLTGDKKTIVTHSSRIRVIQTSPNGQYVYGGTDDGKLIRWDISTGISKIVYDNKGRSVTALTLNRRGNRAVIGDKSGKVIIIDPNTGNRLAQVKGHSARIQDVVYSPDNTQLATSSYDGTIRIWNAAKLSDNPVVITEHESWALAITFSPDGTKLISASEKGDIFYWPSRTDYMASEVCGYISRNFTDQEWDIYVGMDVDYQKTCINKN